GKRTVAGWGEQGEAVVVGRPRPHWFVTGFHDDRGAATLTQGVGGGESGLPAADDERVDVVHGCLSFSLVFGVLARESRAAATVIAPSSRKAVAYPSSSPATAAPANGASAIVIVSGADSSPVRCP